MSNKPWDEYAVYVLKELERLDACVKDNRKYVNNNCTRLSVIEAKAAVWGAVGGILITLGMMIVKHYFLK